MGAIEYIDRLKVVDDMIRRRFKGNAAKLGRQIGVSRRTVFNYFETLRQWGADIQYDHANGCFYYANSFQLKV